MSTSRSRKRTLSSQEKGATTRQQSTKIAAKKTTDKTPTNVENVESDAPSSDNRLQTPGKALLSVRKQTALPAIESNGVAIVSDFAPNVTSDSISTITENIKNCHNDTKLSRSLLPQEDSLKSKAIKHVLPTPTSGLTATKNSDSDNDDADDTMSSSSKRCCKSDLKRCLRAGDIIENSRVPENILKAHNGGKKLLAQFDGQNFIDLQTEKSYRSVTNWVKDRMMELGKLSKSSNISGWDYAIVHREGRTTTLRLLVEETKQKADQMRAAMKDQRDGTFTSPMLSTSFNDSGNALLGSSSNSIFKQTPQMIMTPTFGMPSVMTNNELPTEKAALYKRLTDLRQQVAEVEHIFLTREFK